MSVKSKWFAFIEWLKQAYYVSWLLGVLIVAGGFLWRKFQNSPTLSTVGLGIAILAIVVLIGNLPDLMARSMVRSRERLSQRLFLEPLNELYIDVMKEAQPIHFSDLEWEVRITKEFDSIQFYRWTWAAADTPIFAKFQERGSDVPVIGLDGIEFEPRVVTGGGRVIVVPADDTPTSKGFLLFPIPPLVPRGGSQRVEVRSTWPKACWKLGRLREWDKETFLVPRYISQPIDRLQIRIHMPDLGHQYEATEEFKATSRSFNGLVYEAVVTNVTAGTKLAVKFRRIK